MRIAIISDIHGNIDALEAVLDDIDRVGIDSIFNLGDSLSGPFDAVATAERLISRRIPSISGNHDRALWDRPRTEMGLWEDWIIDDLSDDHLAWLKSLSPSLTEGEVFLCHATPEADDENWLDRRGPENRLVSRDGRDVLTRRMGISSPVICCGHTHTPRLIRLGDQLIVNPGSVGCPAYLDTRSDPPFIHETGAPDARYAILEFVQNKWRATLMAVPYDTGRMAELARQRGAESWAQAIETGWFTLDD